MPQRERVQLQACQAQRVAKEATKEERDEEAKVQDQQAALLQLAAQADSTTQTPEPPSVEGSGGEVKRSDRVAGNCGGETCVEQGPHVGWVDILSDDRCRSHLTYLAGALTAPRLSWLFGAVACLNFRQPVLKGSLWPRSAAWYTSGRCSCQYNYSGTQWKAEVMPEWFEQLTDWISSTCNLKVRPNSCNINRYMGGGQSIGWHSDDDLLFDAKKREAVIVSLSLGASRTFKVRKKGSPGAAKSLPLHNGDLCMMSGMFQKFYEHAVPKERRSGGVRFNLTWRSVVVHQTQCPCCRQE